MCVGGEVTHASERQTPLPLSDVAPEEKDTPHVPFVHHGLGGPGY